MKTIIWPERKDVNNVSNLGNIDNVNNLENMDNARNADNVNNADENGFRMRIKIIAIATVTLMILSVAWFTVSWWMS